MGISAGPRRCSGNLGNLNAIAPNPKPDRFTILDCRQFINSYVLVIRYHDCTNFDGVKVLVFDGKYVQRDEIDPHFSTSYSPIARFKPDTRGLELAYSFAESLQYKEGEDAKA